MRAISLHEPFATLVAIGAKPFETRSWRPDYRGPLAIHASKRFDSLQRWTSALPEFARPLMAAGILPSCGLRPTLGHLLCVVDFTGAYEAEYVVRTGMVEPGSPEHTFGDFSPGRYAWKLEAVRRIPPVPFRGTQGFFFVPDQLVGIEAAA